MFEGPPKNIVPFVWNYVCPKLLMLRWELWIFQVGKSVPPKKLVYSKIIGSKGFKARKEKKKDTQIQAPKKYNPWKKNITPEKN